MLTKSIYLHTQNATHSLVTCESVAYEFKNKKNAKKSKENSKRSGRCDCSYFHAMQLKVSDAVTNSIKFNSFQRSYSNILTVSIRCCTVLGNIASDKKRYTMKLWKTPRKLKLTKTLCAKVILQVRRTTWLQIHFLFRSVRNKKKKTVFKTVKFSTKCWTK